MPSEPTRKALRELLWWWGPVGPDDPLDSHLPASEYDWLMRPLAERDAAPGGQQGGQITPANFSRKKLGSSRPSSKNAGPRPRFFMAQGSGE